jgi:hypothetical protein
MLDSLMYRTSFYDFGQVMTEQGRPMGYDRVRQKEIALKDYELQHLQEAFTRCASFRACLLDLYMFSMCVCVCLLLLSAQIPHRATTKSCLRATLMLNWFNHLDRNVLLIRRPVMTFCRIQAAESSQVDSVVTMMH